MAKDSKGPPPSTVDRLISVHTANETLDRIVDSGIGGVVAAQLPPPRATHTGLTGGYTPALGVEPYFFDQNTLKLVADMAPGTQSSSIESVIAFGGQEFFAGYTSVNNESTLLARIDPSTGAIQYYPSVANSWANGFQAVNGSVYFLEHNDATVSARLGVITAANFQLSYINLPSNINGDNLFLANSKLIVENVLGSSATDLAIYDPVIGTTQTVDLGGTNRVVSDAGFTQGSKFFFFTFDPSTSASNLMSLNLQTGVTTTEYQNVQTQEPIEARAIYQHSAYINDDYFVFVNNTDTNDTSVLRIDENGMVTEAAHSSSTLVYMGQTSTASYWAVGYDTAVDVLKISEDSAGNTLTHLYDTNATGLRFGIDVNGTLYFAGATAGDSDWDLLKLDEASSSLVEVSSFGANNTPYSIQPLAYLDGYLAVAAYNQSTGHNELWTSSTPETAASWQMISGDVSISPGSWTGVLTGDFIL